MESQDGEMSRIEILLRYNNGNFTMFTWEGDKVDGSVKEICQPCDKNTTGLLYVEKAWIRQLGSNSGWLAKSVFLQENVDSPDYVQYGLNPVYSGFSTNG